MMLGHCLEIYYCHILLLYNCKNVQNACKSVKNGTKKNIGIEQWTIPVCLSM